ncbi:hypothetical protein TOT_020000831 [Theileria orientalis strain Shintoku]|uniref:Uncharacterized protein n=1 Tax=Theileria orientalis strain Shintoku TaxID=869250 RepID=J4C3K0_THEOR|nr:hypothetical protein TOT_020000831 [Theileria orientalis strain Shintoku]PVC51708.1 hypothetical protein MACL_00001345 [Theileria orientalis]BAM40576.1 hypothetical protein TOT_020000831 [Theileria orientalis strain Shintoku]|eukprot:XP_009690877.1 hypothetical protein TOT_020000831 [Theileria orientalis strain Shintoku]
MRYKVIFSGLSCMAYLSIIFQKLFYKSKVKKLRSFSKTATDGEATEQGKSQADSNTGDAMSKATTANSSGEKLKHSETSDPQTLSNSGTPSTTSSNHYVATKGTDKMASSGVAKKDFESTKIFVYKSVDGVGNEIPHTMESLNRV